jgi:hypothetical protein
MILVEANLGREMGGFFLVNSFQKLYKLLPRYSNTRSFRPIMINGGKISKNTSRFLSLNLLQPGSWVEKALENEKNRAPYTA